MNRCYRTLARVYESFLSFSESITPNFTPRAVVFGGGKFVAVGQDSLANGTNMMYSYDGLNWTTGNIGQNNNWTGIAFSASLNLYVAISNSGTNRVATSADGITWTLRNASDNLSWASIIWVQAFGEFWAVRTSGATSAQRFMKSSDGVNWSNVSMNVSNGYESINTTDIAYSSYYNSFFVCGSASTQILAKSSDGLNWEYLPPNLINNQVIGIYAPSGLPFISCGSQSGGTSIRMGVSTDGNSFDKVSKNPSGGSYRSFVQVNGVVYSVSYSSGDIMYTKNGTSWHLLKGLPFWNNDVSLVKQIAYSESLAKTVIVNSAKCYISN